MDLKEKQFFPHKMSKNNYNFPVQLGYLNWNLSKSTLIGTSTWYIYILWVNNVPKYNIIIKPIPIFFKSKISLSLFESKYAKNTTIKGIITPGSPFESIDIALNV